jgi:hypothetical protein
MKEIRCCFRIIIWIFLFLILIFLINPAISDDTSPNSQVDIDYIHENMSGLLMGENEQDLSLLITLLKKIGIDLSYGEDGASIFSMVDLSLNQVIGDLSSGNPQGVMNNPLVCETMKEFGVNMDEIILDPQKFNGTLKAIEGYDDQYAIK